MDYEGDDTVDVRIGEERGDAGIFQASTIREAALRQRAGLRIKHRPRLITGMIFCRSDSMD